MQDLKSIMLLENLVLSSEYFLQVTLDNSGKVISAHSGLGPAPSLFDAKEKEIFFSDCFLSSDWSKYENQRQKAWKNNHQSFTVELQKINHPEGTTSLSKWEFFFISNEHGTCLGIGHPLEPLRPYSLGIGEFIEGTNQSGEILNTVLENKLLGFWDFDPRKKEDSLSNGLAHILGYTHQEIEKSGKISWRKHIHPEDYLEVVKSLETYTHSPGDLPYKKEFRLISRGKQTVWVIGFGKPTQWDKEGIPSKIQGLLIDITEKKKQEIWLKEHHYFLRDLAFHQSHSLRARVANILGILEILDLEDQGLETRKLLEIVKKESQMLDNSLKKSIKESVQQNETWERGIIKNQES
jgi:PAS domain S-box-containing protein